MTEKDKEVNDAVMEMLQPEPHVTQEQVSSALQQLGLTSSESKIYLFIATHEPMSASQISNEMDIERSKGYRVVESLVQKSLISQTMTNPRLCIITDCASSIDGLIHEWEERFVNGKKNRDMIVDFIKYADRKSKEKLNVTGSHISVLNSKNALYSHLKTQISNCNSNIYIYTSGSDIMKMYYSKIPELLKKVASKGHQCLIIIDKDISKISKMYKGCKVIKVSKPITGRIIVLEDQLTIMSNKLEPSFPDNKSDISLSINEPQIVKNMQQFFKLVVNN